MKIYDCFIYFDEDLLLDVRLNIMDKFVDKFVIVESKFSHRGELREPTFNINKFKKFEKKIEYILLDKNPSNLHEIKKNDKLINEKIIINGNLREFYQRNSILKGLKSASDEDLILISDVDEIPFLENIDFNEIQNKLVFFNQIFCCYKFNLFSKMKWCGSRMVKKKKLIDPQWLRDIKDRNYPMWRIDTLFSKKKYNNIKFIENGGWHFSYLKNPKGVQNKLKSIRHHIEYDLNPLGESKIENLIKNRKLIYNYRADQRSENKFENNETLNILEIKKLPDYIQKNISLFSDWLEK
jgi:beta-1,4-mannosyl-glycoprotein beta-1,4-N-acetylglucosaminyltransferase